jgi:hypothetical protein
MKETSKIMRKLYDLYGIYLPIFLLILPSVVALRTVALFTNLGEYGHFENDLLANISAYLVAAAAIFFITYAWVGKKGIKLIPSFASPLNYVPAGLVAVAVAMLGANLAANAMGMDLAAASLYQRVISILTPLLAFGAVAYFVLASVLIARRSIRRSDFGIITLAFICMYVAYIYFDTSLPINAPTKLTDEIAYLGIAMFFIGETRLSLGRESWRRYISFAFIGAILTAYSSIPNLIYYIARVESVSLSIYETLLTFAFFAFITSKIFLTPMLVKDERSGVVDKIIAAAAARAEALEPTRTEEPEEQSAQSVVEDDENQITITYAEPAEEGTEMPEGGEEEQEITRE